ncbi:SatD family (SatD) [Sporobacter termitidis DSM 10068]|uniref:SatD family (SatD) n=1 Tax=Sporobacter termitidis DSM 10068 TaxID=1123282 RepID=A0A1M5ZHL6_9FIRM|nr:SatD family protein [Sporobacter termitidis]SHI23619.1 SatD family (SatD) [Sporobacter termitidis DSM 10068]
MYCAMIGDLIGSRSMSAEERHHVQEELKQILGGINSAYADVIASKFTLTLGDEFQGLLKSSQQAVEIAERLIKELHPHGIRFGIGLGEIYTDIDPDKALGADGPAYHLAREGVDALKADGRFGKGFAVAFHTDKPDAMLLNALCRAVSDIESAWTDRQREIVWAAEKFDGRQRPAANALKISKSVVSRQLKAANFSGYRYLLDSLGSYLRLQYDALSPESSGEPKTEL